MSLKKRLVTPFLPVLLLLTSCVIATPYVNPAKLEPPAQYNHPYDGQVVERVMPLAQVRSVCMSMGVDLFATACSWHSAGACYIVIPNDGQGPVSAYRQHEIAHCNGWPANHP